MKQGIAILGLNGAGKSTLAHELAKKIGYFEMDLEDYYFPEQKSSRIYALDEKEGIKTNHLGNLPFSEPKTKSEVQTMILNDIKVHPKFILSGVTLNWSMEICSRVKTVFFIDVPLPERLKRIQKREELRFGGRVLPGGDMYFQQQEFLKTVALRDFQPVKRSIEKLCCPVIKLDGTLPINKNIEKILNYLK